MNVFALSGLFIASTTTLLSLFILLRAKKMIHFIWILFCWSVAIWGFGVYRIAIESNELMAIFWWHFAYVGVIFIPTLYLHFIYKFIKKDNKYLIASLYLISLFFVYLNIFTDKLISQLKYVFGGYYYIASPSFIYNIFVILFFSLVVYSVLILNKERRVSQGHYRDQIKYFLIATYIGYGGGLFAFLPVYLDFVCPAPNILIALFPFIIAYAVFRHRMMDIGIVMQKGIVYSFLLTMIIGIYLMILFALELLFHQMGRAVVILAGLITTIIGIYGSPVIERYFRKKTDKIFFKDKYDYGQAIYELSKILNKNINIEILLREISEKLKNILKVKFLSFVLLDGNLTFDEKGGLRESAIKVPKYMIAGLEKKIVRILSKEDILNSLSVARKNKDKEKTKILLCVEKISNERKAAIFVPIFLEKKLVAVLLLSKKLSGDSFAKEDYNLLKTFSYQAGVALEKARLFEKVKDYSTKLEKKVKQRTVKIKGLQKEQEQMMHEVAHGLQTPLTVLKFELTQAAEKGADKKKFKLIEKSIDRISKMIYDMLRLAKLESGRGEKDFKEINLSELLEELIESFEIITSAQKIKLEHKVEPGIVLLANSSEIEELITNLVSNSVKYINDQGPKKILIELKSENNKINLSISDTGIGMSQDTLRHLFKRFYRAKNEPKYSKKGTGLGLVIAKKIVEKHGGEIKVRSKLKKGTEFLISFSEK